MFEPKDFGVPWILTLKRRKDRFDACMDRIRAIDDWPFEQPEPFYGFDGHADGFTPPYWVMSDYHQYMSRGGWGCVLSYNLLVNRFLESDREWLFILEDDVWMVDDFTDKVEEFLLDVPGDADCIYVGGNPRSPKQYPPIEINKHVCRPWRVTATHFCMFNRRFCRDLSCHLLDVPIEQMDMHIARMHSVKDSNNRVHGGKYNVYFPRYDLAGQMMGQSDIQVIDAAEIEPMIWGIGSNKLRPYGSDVTVRVQGPIHGTPVGV